VYLNQHLENSLLFKVFKIDYFFCYNPASPTKLDLQMETELLKLLNNFFSHLLQPDDSTEQGMLVDKSEISHYLSGGMVVGIDNLMWYFKTLLEKFPKSNMVSVGSGNGVVERIICEKLNCNIVCIDPKFNSFLTAPENFTRKPDFATVDEYLHLVPLAKLDFGSDDEPAKSEPEFPKDSEIGAKNEDNTVLFMNWPEPDNTENNHHWDYDTIVKLKPSHIILVYESSGSSGSVKLINWIKKNCGVPIKTESGMEFMEFAEHENEKVKVEFPGYHYVGSSTKEGKDRVYGWPLYTQILWLSREKMEDIPPDFPVC